MPHSLSVWGGIFNAERSTMTTKNPWWTTQLYYCCTSCSTIYAVKIPRVPQSSHDLVVCSGNVQIMLSTFKSLVVRVRARTTSCSHARMYEELLYIYLASAGFRLSSCRSNTTATGNYMFWHDKVSGLPILRTRSANAAAWRFLFYTLDS